MRSLLLALSLCFPSVTLLAASWVSHGPPGAAIRALAVAPAKRSVLYVITADMLLRSSDAGATWSDVTGPLTKPSAVVVSSVDPDAVAALGQNGVFRSSDGGASWQAATGLPSTGGATRLIENPSDPNILYLAGNCFGVYKSTDGGRSFVPTNNGLVLGQLCVARLALDPTAPDHLFLYFNYFGDLYGTMQSLDGASSWQRAENAPTGTVVAGSDGRRFGTDAAHIILTSADGLTWAQVGPMRSDQPLSTGNALAIDPAANRLFIATSRGAFRSGDGGIDWLSLGGAARDAVNAIDFDPATGAVVIATSYGLFRSAGYPWNDWTELHTGVDALPIGVVVTDPVNGDVYASSGRHLFRSKDAGASWQEIATPLVSPPTNLVVDASHNVYAAVYDTTSRLVRLNANGSWDEVTASVSFNVFDHITAHPRQPGMLYDAGESARLTLDGGATWQSLRPPARTSFFSIHADPRDTDTFLAIVTDGSTTMLVKTTNAGDTWSGNKLPANWNPFWLWISPTDPNVIYLTVWPGETRMSLARSVDGGETWSVLPKQPGLFDNTRAGIAPDRLIIDPRNPDIVYAAMAFNGAGLVRTIDGGASWQPIDDGLPSDGPPKLAIDPTGSTLYAGTTGRGVWQMDVRYGRRRAVIFR